MWQQFVHVVSTIATDIFTSPLNSGLLLIIFFLMYKIFVHKKSSVIEEPTREIPDLKKHDMTLEELSQYDGTDNYGRICVGVNGKVFDVTKNGSHFYGREGPYSVIAGKDASRALAVFSMEKENIKSNVHDDLSDLSTDQMEQLLEWERQFAEKYVYVGKLLKPGQLPTHYSDMETDDEDEGEESASPDNQRYDEDFDSSDTSPKRQAHDSSNASNNISNPDGSKKND